ncbi:hypothetical protein BGZ52_009714, partial [Haplosporangium bisporale]
VMVTAISISVSGHTDGYASSTKAELIGLRAAILSAPLIKKNDIQLDNQAVVHQFISL